MSLVVVNQSGEGDQTNLEEYSWTRHIKSHTDSRHTTIKQTSEIACNLEEASDLYVMFSVSYFKIEKIMNSSRAFLTLKISPSNPKRPIIAFKTSRTSKTLKKVMTYRATFDILGKIICIFFKYSFSEGH